MMDCPLLYHYTNIDALLNILKTKQIWLTHISQMNDSSEGKLILERAKGNRKYEKRYYQLLLKNSYLCSFSHFGNLLSQWRAYGDVNIGFSRESLEDASRFIEDMNGEKHDTSGVQFFDCEYVNEEEPMFNEVIEAVIKRLKKIPLRPPKSDPFEKQRELLAIGLLCFRYKHSGFKEESESRIFAYLWNRKPFINGKKKYIKYRFDSNSIKRIVIGPSKKKQYNIERIQDLIDRNKEYKNIEIRESGIPFIGFKRRRTTAST